MTSVQVGITERRIEHVGVVARLGRRAAPDQRDVNFPLRALAPVKLAKQYTTRYWPMFVGPLDQGPTPQCVAYSWTGFLLSTPVTHKPAAFPSVGRFAQQLYSRAQQIDEWPGENYDGTSVRAGAKALTEQGRLAEYRWAFDAETARDFVLARGPVIFGTDWHVEMFVPDPAGYIDPRGEVVGGHAYLAIGFSRSRDAFRILNSWGAGWGQRGRVWLKRAHAARLIEAYGECCSATEIKPT